MQFMDKAVDTPVVAQRQVSQVHVVAETAETPQFRVADKVVDVPVVLVVQAPPVQVMAKTVQIPQFPFGEKIAAEIRMASGTQTSESLNGEFDAGHDEKSDKERQPHNSSKQPTQSAQERESEGRVIRGGEKKKGGQVEKEKGQGRKRRGRKRKEGGGDWGGRKGSSGRNRQ